MAHYLIFIEANGVDPKCLVAAGLGDLLADCEPSPDFVAVDRGPNGKPGQLISWRRGNQETDPKIQMHDRLSWQPSVAITHPELGELAAERYWLGVDMDNPVQPSDLIRDTPIPGTNVTLADGYSWMVPTISRLPNRYQLNDGGEVSRVVKEKYQKFYETGMRVVAECMEQFGLIEEVRDKVPNIEQFSIPLEAKGGMHLIASALALNYRINWELAFMLDLLDEHSGAMALMTFCELREIRSTIVKKKELPPVTIPVGWYSESGSKA